MALEAAGCVQASPTHTTLEGYSKELDNDGVGT